RLHGVDLSREVFVCGDAEEARVRRPESVKRAAAGGGGGGVLDAAGVGGVAVVEAEGGAGLEPYHRVIPSQLGGVGGGHVRPVVVDAIGPVGGAVEGAAVEQERLAGIDAAGPFG